MTFSQMQRPLELTQQLQFDAVDVLDLEGELLLHGVGADLEIDRVQLTFHQLQRKRTKINTLSFTIVWVHQNYHKSPAIMGFKSRVLVNFKSTMERISEESHTLDQYLRLSKREQMEAKKKSKEEAVRPRRKESTQLSIFTWLCKPKQKQTSLMVSLDKGVVLNIFSYLRVGELFTASQVCSYFLSCYRSLWTDKSFFCQLETDKLTSDELGKLIQKSSRLDHIKQLKQLYSGKNIRHLREKIKLKVGDGSQRTGGMLEVFSVTPKAQPSRSTFITDSHLQQIVNSSFRSLKVVELVKCGMLKKLGCLARCHQLMKLTVSSNDNFRNEDLGQICKSCTMLEELHLQDCRRLDECIFEHIKQVEMLQKLTLKGFRQSCIKLKLLENNPYLTHLNLDNSLIKDIELRQVISLKSLTILSIKNCSFLDDAFIDFLTRKLNETSLQRVEVTEGVFDDQKVERLREALMDN